MKTTTGMTDRILAMGENDLMAFCDDPENKDVLQVMENELHHIATVAAARGTYIAMRHGCGCGDQGHAAAKKKMERAQGRAKGHWVFISIERW